MKKLNFLSGKVPYEHIQSHEAGRVPFKVSNNMIKLSQISDNDILVTFAVDDTDMASLLSWDPIDGDASNDVTFLRSMLLYPGLTLSEHKENVLCTAYIHQRYEEAVKATPKYEYEPAVTLHAMEIKLPPFDYDSLKGTSPESFILDIIASNTKSIRLYNEDNKTFYTIPILSRWMFNRIFAHMIVRSVWSEQRKHIAALTPKGIFSKSYAERKITGP